MPDLVIIAYGSEDQAEAARKRLFELQREHLIELSDAVVAVREGDGTVRLNQLVNMTAAGAASGGMWGALVGLIFLNPMLGAAMGAGAGALSGHFADVGINDEFMREAAAALAPGEAALCVMVRRVTANAILPQMAQFGGRLLRTQLSDAQEYRLRETIGAY
jgi:uncharacterized membrane protein